MGGNSCDNLMLKLKRVHLATRRAFDEALHDFRLTGPQAEILRQVWQLDGIELRVLQERLGITSATLTGICDGLVERELLERRQSPEDARVKQLFLTAHGQALNHELALIAEQTEARLLEGFSSAERALLADWLERMVSNIGAPHADSCS